MINLVPDSDDDFASPFPPKTSNIKNKKQTRDLTDVMTDFSKKLENTGVTDAMLEDDM